MSNIAAAERTEKISFANCVNCGKYIETELKGKTLYCCPECTEKSGKCGICGRYFNIDNLHIDSLKCRIIFNINKKGFPFIQKTNLKLFIIGNPFIRAELISQRLSLVLKLPVFMSEQLRIENALSPERLKEKIDEKIKAENLTDHFIFLSNSNNADFIEELMGIFQFDKCIIINNTDHESEQNHLKFQICTKCGNINSFSEPDYEGKSECLICRNEFFRTTEGETSIQQKLKNFRVCESYLYSAFPDKCVSFNFEDIPDTVNSIVKYLIYT
jgi:hypothetical protein